MKKAILTLGGLTFAGAAPIVSAQAAAEAATAQTAAFSDEERAVQRYVLNTSAATLERMADLIEESDGTAMSQARLVVAAAAIVADMPVDELPAAHQQFAREQAAISKASADTMQGIIDKWESGEMSDDEAEAAIVALQESVMAQQAELESRYPESAKLLGMEAVQNMTARWMSEFEGEVGPRLRAHLAEHPEDSMDERRLFVVSLRIIAQIFREKAAALYGAPLRVHIFSRPPGLRAD